MQFPKAQKAPPQNGGKYRPFQAFEAPRIYEIQLFVLANRFFGRICSFKQNIGWQQICNPVRRALVFDRFLENSKYQFDVSKSQGFNL